MQYRSVMMPTDSIIAAINPISRTHLSMVPMVMEINLIGPMGPGIFPMGLILLGLEFKLQPSASSAAVMFNNKSVEPIRTTQVRFWETWKNGDDRYSTLDRYMQYGPERTDNNTETERSVLSLSLPETSQISLGTTRKHFR